MEYGGRFRSVHLEVLTSTPLIVSREAPIASTVSDHPQEVGCGRKGVDDQVERKGTDIKLGQGSVNDGIPIPRVRFPSINT